jgi:3-hydroxyacyl-CoA dehydrogenase/enoyl-CoA hydratase/3-hydroxybutyryl-CoA epimerase
VVRAARHHGHAAGPRARAHLARDQARAELYKKRLKQPHLVQAALDRLIPTSPATASRAPTSCIEAIVENAEVKRKVFAQVEPRMKAGAILASNTSSIPLQELAGVLKRPERLLGLHFFNPSRRCSW